jgi:hypothetical protein
MAQVTLQQVVAECFRNKQFFQTLQTDIESALSSKHWSLSASDMEELRSHLANPIVQINIIDFVNQTHELLAGVAPSPPPTWNIIPVWWIWPTKGKQ